MKRSRRCAASWVARGKVVTTLRDDEGTDTLMRCTILVKKNPVIPLEIKHFAQKNPAPKAFLLACALF
jgi:hypothetical protein